MSLWGRAWAALYDRSMAASERAGLADRRAALLAEARGRVLEIGAGTGLNLPHYPPAVTQLVLAEPDPDVARRLRKGTDTVHARARTGTDTVHARAEVVEAGAERLPFADGAFDTVVSTLVLCTAGDPAAALDEVARVLAPGGRFLFFEHVRSTEDRVARTQDRVAPVWRIVGRGCRCNQDTRALLAQSSLAVERIDADRIPKAAKFVRPAIRGSASSTRVQG